MIDYENILARCPLLHETAGLDWDQEYMDSIEQCALGKRALLDADNKEVIRLWLQAFADGSSVEALEQHLTFTLLGVLLVGAAAQIQQKPKQKEPCHGRSDSNN